MCLILLRVKSTLPKIYEIELQYTYNKFEVVYFYFLYSNRWPNQYLTHSQYV